MSLSAKVTADIIEYISPYLDRFPKTTIESFSAFHNALNDLYVGNAIDPAYKNLEDLKACCDDPKQLIAEESHTKENLAIVHDLIRTRIQQKMQEIMAMSDEEKTQEIERYAQEQATVHAHRATMLTKAQDLRVKRTLDGGEAIVVLRDVGFTDEGIETLGPEESEAFFAYPQTFIQMVQMGFPVDYIMGLSGETMSEYGNNAASTVRLIELGFSPQDIQDIMGREDDAYMELVEHLDELAALLDQGFSVDILKALEYFPLTVLLDYYEDILLLRGWGCSVEHILAWNPENMRDIVRNIEWVEDRIDHGMVITDMAEAVLMEWVWHTANINILMDKGFTQQMMLNWNAEQSAIWFNQIQLADWFLQRGFTPDMIGSWNSQQIQLMLEHHESLTILITAGFSPGILAACDDEQRLNLFLEVHTAVCLLESGMDQHEICQLSKEALEVMGLDLILGPPSP
jgi:hypothetical protein